MVLIPTTVLKIDPESPEPFLIDRAAALIRQGRLVAFPTETVYGLGADALDRAAISRIYEAKQRPAGDPVIAHIHEQAQLPALSIDTPEAAFALAEHFWPGPLTLVLRRAPQVPDNIASGRDTVAIRMPAHPVARALLAAAETPIAAPSANRFTRPSATTAQHVMEDLDGRIDLILDGGPTNIGLESTVVDLTGPAPVILRPGGLVIDALRAVIPSVTLLPRYSGDDALEVAPGQMLKHYSPNAHVCLFRGPLYTVLLAMQAAAREHIETGAIVGMLVADEDRHHLEKDLDPAVIISTLGPRNDLRAISHNLFAGLRYLDSCPVDVILTRGFGREGLGAALWDRLTRAAEGHVIEVR